MIPRNMFIGASVEPVPSEGDNYYHCKLCSGWVDMRDLGAVLSHEGPMPHPAEDQAH